MKVLAQVWYKIYAMLILCSSKNHIEIGKLTDLTNFIVI